MQHVFMLKTVQTKTNTDIAFYEWPEEYILYVERVYGDKKIYRESVLSKDDTVKTDIVCWTSKEDYLTFWEDANLTKWFDEGVRHRVVNEIDTLRVYKDMSLDEFNRYLNEELND